MKFYSKDTQRKTVISQTKFKHSGHNSRDSVRDSTRCGRRARGLGHKRGRKSPDICVWRNQNQNENQAITDGEILGSSAMPRLIIIQQLHAIYLFQGHTTSNSYISCKFKHSRTCSPRDTQMWITADRAGSDRMAVSDLGVDDVPVARDRSSRQPWLPGPVAPRLWLCDAPRSPVPCTKGASLRDCGAPCKHGGRCLHCGRWCVLSLVPSLRAGDVPDVCVVPVPVAVAGK